MNKIFFISIFTTINLIFGQNYVWPTDTGKQLTSNFGEFRDKHFHMGLDIRTKQSIGHPIYAVEDGYIYRIATNFSGYGKVLYLKTINDKIAVYGHLNRFSEQLENRLFELQNENRSYLVNRYFTQEEYPVKCGEIIGYSGNSGGSTGPHLHFELRNELDQPLNPLISGFLILDNVAPQFLDLSIIPLGEKTQIDDSPLPQNYIPTQSSYSEYILKDTIAVAGVFGISTRITDKIQGAIYSYQIEKLELLIDSISTFSVQYNLLDFSESKNIATVYGQPINHSKHDDFQKLYRLEPYPKLIIHKDDKNGVINLTDGIHKVEILAWDAAQNKSVLTFYVKSNIANKRIQYKTLLNNKDYQPFENDSNVFNPEIIQLENGTIFKIQTNIETTDKIEAFIEKQDKLLTFPLIKIDIDKYASEMLSTYLFKDIQSCGFLIHADVIQKYDFDFTPVVILPDSVHNIISTDSLCTVKTNKSFYDTTSLWISKQDSPLPDDKEYSKSNVYKLQPYGIPYRNDIIMSFFIEENFDLNHYAIYTFNDKKSKWDFEETNIDTINRIISSILSESNICTILEDTIPPEFVSLHPEDNKIYALDTLKKFLITLRDDLSGINSSEEHLQVFLDGKRIWVTYQPVDKEISYILKNALTIGEHSLQINIQDRSGNSASKTIKFFVE